jgi:arylsulfatase A
MAHPAPMGTWTLARRMAAAAILVAASIALPGATRPVSSTGGLPASARPNVLVIVVDDLGWADTGAYGSAFHETPAIDRLARDGVRFTQFYAASPVCSPTRASLMTGKYPSRLHITDWIGGDDTGPLSPPAYEHALPLEEVTIGEAFRDAGYVTGYLGKWHLGDGPFMPGAQGFAFTKAVNRAGQPASYFFPYRGSTPSVWSVPDLEGGSPGEYLTDRLTDESIAFVRAHKDEPFLLVLSHYAVHTPLEAPEALAAKYEARARALPAAAGDGVRVEGAGAFTKTRQDHPVYAAMVERTDASVGRLLAEVDALGLAPRTIVVFVSDNGGLSTLTRRTGMPTSNAPLRAGKGWLYEGGIRVPLIVRWPGRLSAGRVVDVPAITTDLFPTLLGLAGLPQRPAQHADGVDLGAALTGRTAQPGRSELFWDFPHYHGSGHTPSSAVRAGDLKLIEWYGDGRTELYDLAADPGETRDLAPTRPAEVERLRRRLQEWRVMVGARVPTRNTAWREGR